MSVSHTPLVSVVLPVRNGAPWLRDVITAIANQTLPPFEILVVEDGSEDASREILQGLSPAEAGHYSTWDPALAGLLTVIDGPRRGAAAALNAGFRAARGSIVCQIDQDVRLDRDWIRRVTAWFERERVGAVQGYYANDRSAGVWARVMALDLEQRYAAIDGSDTSHVCTGNSAYLADAVRAVGGFDETLGYGYDNDMSYRLSEAGYRLVMCREARSVHHWRETFRGYCRQQYGFGYGRLDLIARHPRRCAGDSVSPLPMILHPLLLCAALALLIVSGAMATISGDGRGWFVASLLLAGALALERAVAGAQAAIQFKDPAALLFPFAHLIRDIVWSGAVAMWILRRLAGRPARPAHSMKPRRPTAEIGNWELGIGNDRALARRPVRVLVLIPAHNEAASLPTVIAELRRECPSLDVLVIDDGSTDGTPLVLTDLGVAYVRLPERLGVGSAMRAGLSYAVRLGYDGAVRLDGDGQHGPADVERMVAPIFDGAADVVMGSRFISTSTDPSLLRVTQRALALCLSTLTGSRVTDPTSGFWAFGPRAVRVLASQHPTGYPEPELRLLLSRTDLRVVECAVEARPRVAGRTSLTFARAAAAAARVMLAFIIVPLRTGVRLPR